MGITLVIRGEAKTFIKCVAKQDGIYPWDVVRRALSLYRHLREMRERDGQLVLRRADGTHERLDLP